MEFLLTLNVIPPFKAEVTLFTIFAISDLLSTIRTTFRASCGLLALGASWQGARAVFRRFFLPTQLVGGRTRHGMSEFLLHDGGIQTLRQHLSLRQKTIRIDQLDRQ